MPPKYLVAQLPDMRGQVAVNVQRAPEADLSLNWSES